MHPLNVLIVQDSESDAALLLTALRKGGFSPAYHRVSSAPEMSRALDAQPWDIVISDYSLPHFSSSAALNLLRTKSLDLPFIIVTAPISADAAVNAVKAGAGDCLFKANLDRLAPAVKREIRAARLRAGRVQNSNGLTARDTESRRRHIRHLAALSRLSQSLGEAKDFDSLLRRSLDGVIKALRFSSGALFLRDPLSGEFSLSAHTRLSLEFADCLNTLFARSGAAVPAAAAAGSSYLPRSLDRTSVTDARKLGLQPEHARFVVSVPLKALGRTIAIVLLPAAGKKVLSTEEKHFLATLGSQLGAAVQNALLLRQMNQLSITDELTGLYNRRHFSKILDIEIDRAQRYHRPVSLAILDIDRFKDYNDRFGHVGGDSVLKSLAEALLSNLRKTDICFRFGGDEFALILPETDSHKANSVIERLRSKWLRTPKTASLYLENPLGFSAGIAEFPRDAPAQDSLLSLADAALYYSKRGGGYQSTSVSEMR